MPKNTTACEDAVYEHCESDAQDIIDRLDNMISVRDDLIDALKNSLYYLRSEKDAEISALKEELSNKSEH